MSTVATSLHDLRRPSAEHSSRWLQVLSHIDPKYGGLSSAIPALAAVIEQAGTALAPIAAFCSADEQTVPADLAAREVSLWPSSRRAWWTSSSLRHRYTRQVDEADGIHIHGLWEQSSTVSASLARRLRKPYVVSAHGMLEPWALNNKRWKKVFYSALVERPMVQNASCLHALTQAEVNSYREYGAANPVAVIPNGVDLPESTDSSSFLAGHPELAGKRLILFLGRLHPKKGLDLLLQAWASLEHIWPEAHIVIAGPDCNGTQAALEAQITSLGLRNVLFTGMLSGAAKWNALAASECFVLPSHSEGLSMGILEAMGMGLPVIATRPCNMPEITTFKTGWEIEPQAGELATALQHFLCDSPENNCARGLRGRMLVQERYSWARVGRSMTELYTWLRGGPKPRSCEVLLP